MSIWRVRIFKIQTLGFREKSKVVIEIMQFDRVKRRSREVKWSADHVIVLEGETSDLMTYGLILK